VSPTQFPISPALSVYEVDLRISTPLEGYAYHCNSLSLYSSLFPSFIRINSLPNIAFSVQLLLEHHTSHYFLLALLSVRPARGHVLLRRNTHSGKRSDAMWVKEAAGYERNICRVSRSRSTYRVLPTQQEDKHENLFCCTQCNLR
jgi:hypothetical protein